MLLIPAIDLRGGRCVRLYQGDFAKETVYDTDPCTVLERYRDLGARWVHVVDLDGARDGRAAHRETLRRLARTRRAPALQVGGGVRTEDDVRELLEMGASRVVVGSVAVHAPDVVRGWMDRHGTERFVVAFDVRIDEAGTPCVASHGWRDVSATSLWDALGAVLRPGMRVLCTDVSRDGALAGPNLELYGEAAARFPSVEWQASGGIRHAGDLALLRGTGVKAAISGRALLEGRLKEEEVLPFFPSE